MADSLITHEKECSVFANGSTYSPAPAVEGVRGPRLTGLVVKKQVGVEHTVL